MVRQFSSTAVETTLAAGASPSDTTITVASTSGYPVATPYTLSIDAENASKELVEVTGVAGTTLTVTRGIDGTAAVSHSLGAVVRHDHSARDFREAAEHIAASADVHGVSGDLVGETTAQVLTNKDLTDPSNTFPSSLALDADVAAVSTALSDHLNDATDAHDASAISFSPTGTIAATNVQTAVAEVASEATSALAVALPPGVMTEYAGSSAPTGWLLCDGSEVSRATFAGLFAAIGTTYGSGDGSTTFNVPNRKGRVGVGLDASQTEFDTLGETGGAKTHTLTTAETPAHTHSIDHDHGSVATDAQGTHAHGVSVTGSNTENGAGAMRVNSVGGASVGSSADVGGTGSTNSAGSHTHNVNLPNFTGTSGSAGDGGAHNNLQPYIVVNHIIKT